MNCVAHMKISEYVIRPDLPVPLDVVEKIYLYHAMPMNIVRDHLGRPIYVSKNSGFRHEEHEIEKGRTDLMSEHLFRPLDRPGSERGFGASDYRATLKMMPYLAKLIIECTQYSRITFYPNVATPFFHCDYRFGFDTTRTYIAKKSWIQVPQTEFIDQISINVQEKQ